METIGRVGPEDGCWQEVSVAMKPSDQKSRRNFGIIIRQEDSREHERGATIKGGER